MSGDSDATTIDRLCSASRPAAILRRLRRRPGGDGASVALRGKPAARDPGCRHCRPAPATATALPPIPWPHGRAISRPGPRASSICSWPADRASSSCSTTSPSSRNTRPADPRSFVKGRRFAFMDIFTKEPPKLLGTGRKFARHGQSGAWVSELLPHMAEVVDDMAIVRSVATECSTTPRPSCSSTPARRSSAGPAWAPGSPTASAASRRPARLRGPAIGPARPARRAVHWGSGFLPDGLPGRAVPRRRRADPEPEHAARDLAAPAAPGHRGDRRA